MSTNRDFANGFMDDDDDEEYGGLRKANGRKTLAALYVYQILRENTNSRKHFRQKDIIDRLEEYPYELTLERKAVGRILHLLEEEDELDICVDKTSGAWYEAGIHFKKAC